MKYYGSLEQILRRAIGPLFDELLQVMHDLSVAPIYLFGDQRGRLVIARDAARAAAVQFCSSNPDLVRSVVDLVPAGIRLPDLPDALIEGGTWNAYFAKRWSDFSVWTSSARVASLAPGLGEVVDDDGLVPVDALECLPHAAFYGELALHYHPFLRRAFHGSINDNLIATLLRHSRSASVRIALDQDRVRFRDEEFHLEERDYWYGPPLIEATLDDLHTTGVTIHGAPDGGSSLAPYVAVAAKWTRSGTEKTLQVEEQVLVDEPGRDAREPVLARYLHAIRDTTRGCFVHCDGAVKGYDQATYPRTEHDFGRRMRAPAYRKVFRIDGEITTGSWSDLTVQWFRENVLVAEYLATLIPGAAA